jgi:hypothetical protein
MERAAGQMPPAEPALPASPLLVHLACIWWPAGKGVASTGHTTLALGNNYRCVPSQELVLVPGEHARLLDPRCSGSSRRGLVGYQDSS